MAADYLTCSQLAADASFQMRVAHAVAQFANYILNEAENTANHKQRFWWAASAALNPASVAQAIAQSVTLNADVNYAIALPAQVTDAMLQPAVETVCALLLFK